MRTRSFLTMNFALRRLPHSGVCRFAVEPDRTSPAGGSASLTSSFCRLIRWEQFHAHPVKLHMKTKIVVLVIAAMSLARAGSASADSSGPEILSDLAAATPDPLDLKPLEAQFMLSGYCHAGSRKDNAAPGGYGRSDNLPKRRGEKPWGTEAQLSLVALPAETVPFALPAESVPFEKQYQGFRLLLVNRTADEVAFRACDSRLYIICEARDETGHWKASERLPWSGCGNSHHRVFLPSDQYWEFAAPVYSGNFKTKLRFHLEGKQPIYSNEFEGYINPAQFKNPLFVPASGAVPARMDP